MTLLFVALDGSGPTNPPGGGVCLCCEVFPTTEYSADGREDDELPVNTIMGFLRAAIARR